MARYETKAKFARRMKTKPARVSEQIKRGLPETKNGFIPSREGREWWEANVRMRVDSAMEEEVSLPLRIFKASRAKKMAHDADKAEADAARAQLELKIAQGQFISVDEVDRTWFDILRMTRERIQAIPDRVSARLAADLGVEEAANKVRLILGNEIRTALDALSTELKYKRNATPDTTTARASA